MPTLNPGGTLNLEENKKTLFTKMTVPENCPCPTWRTDPD